MPELDRVVTLRPRGLPPVEWTTIEAAGEWIANEVAAWQPLQNATLSPLLAQIRNELTQPLSKAAVAITQVTARPTSTDAIRTAQSEIISLVPMYAGGPLIASASPDGQALLNRVQKGESAGAVLEAALRVNRREFSIQISGQQMDAKLLITEAAKLVIWDVIEKNQIASHQASHTAILAEFSQKLQSALDRFEEDRLRLVQSQEVIEEGIERAKHKEARLRKQAASAIRSMRSEFFKTKALFTSYMSLKAPGDYWLFRRILNLVAWVFWLLAFVAATAAAGYFVTKYAHDIKEWLTDADGKVDVAALLLLSPAVVLVLWFFRMLARLQSVGLTESVDAGQRRVMLATFRALTNDQNSKLSDAERFLILQALFRPSGSKDEPETLPANMIEALSKALQGRH